MVLRRSGYPLCLLHVHVADQPFDGPAGEKIGHQLEVVAHLGQVRLFVAAVAAGRAIAGHVRDVIVARGVRGAGGRGGAARASIGSAVTAPAQPAGGTNRCPRDPHVIFRTAEAGRIAANDAGTTGTNLARILIRDGLAKLASGEFKITSPALAATVEGDQ